MALSDYRPSMVDGKIVRLSVSQLSRFDTRETGGCQRKWWYRYVGKVPDPPRQAQQEGIDGHARFEAYYRGQAVAFMDCDVPALKELPAVGEAQPEVKLENLTCLRIPFQGSMDLLHGNNVYDYKYQSKIRVYKEPTAQLWGYLEEVRLRDNSGGRLGFHHVYIQKKAPFRAEKVSQFFEPREVERNWQNYASLIGEMHQVAAEKDVEKVAINKSACCAYGPCPYIGICNRNPKQEEDIMGFLEDIEAAKKQLAGGATVNLPEVNASLHSDPPGPMFKAEMNAQVLKALPPDAPPADAVPVLMPEPTVKRGPGRPRKTQNVDASGEIPDSSPTYAPKAAPAKQTKTIGLGLKIGLPEYSSAEAYVELTGTDEDKMVLDLEAMLMRRLERAITTFQKALDLKKAKVA